MPRRHGRPHDARMQWDHEPGDGWASLLVRVGVVVGIVSGVLWHAGWWRG